MIRILFRAHWPMFLTVTLFALVGAVVTMEILSHISQLTTETSGVLDRSTFEISVGWIALLLAADTISQLLLARLGAALVARLRSELAQRCIDLDYEKMMNRRHIVSDALVGDIYRIAPLMLEGPQVAYSAAVVVLCSGYLVTVSLPLFVVLGGAFSVLIVIFATVERSARAQFDQMRTIDGGLAQSYRSISEGKKEMTLNLARARHFAEQCLAPSIDDAKALMTKLHLRWGWNQSWSVVGLYATVLGIVYCGFRVLEQPPSIILSFVVGAFFLIGPLSTLLRSGQAVGTAMASLRHLENLGLDLATALEQRRTQLAEKGETKVSPSWTRLRADGLCYRYPDEEGSGRIIGPISLTVARGETVFIIGGNGSGKSTMLLLLCGLLSPCAGRILIDDAVVNPASEPYRRLFSGVFADCHLFSDVIDIDGRRLADTEIESSLAELGLDSRVKVSNGRLSTLAVSTGQRKRLAFLQCRIENRDIVFFDEWAAEQDPQFRDHFYGAMLADLKQRGKTVIVITHDDRYFHVADRLIKLEAGAIVSGTSEPEIGATQQSNAPLQAAVSIDHPAMPALRATS